MITSERDEQVITEEEKALYDRQIRLWGLEAQNRLRNSKVLLAGLSGCGAEIAKDLVLAGIKSLTLLDNQKVTKDDESNQFLIPLNSVGRNRAEQSKARCQLLNPNVELLVDKDDLSAKDESFFRQFDSVILVDQKYSQVERINDFCRKFHVRFQAAGVFGWVGYGFFDFNNYSFLVKLRKNSPTYTIDNESSDEAGTSFYKKKPRYGSQSTGTAELSTSITVVDDEDEKVKMSIPFASWSSALNFDWSHKKLIRRAKGLVPHIYFPIKALLRAYDNNVKVDTNLIIALWKEEIEKCGKLSKETVCTEEVSFLLGPQLSPTCAIVGAVVAQEAIKVSQGTTFKLLNVLYEEEALSQNQMPLQNLFLYSAYSTSGVVCSLPPVL